MSFSQKNLLALFLGAGLMLSPTAFAKETSDNTSKNSRAPFCNAANTQSNNTQNTKKAGKLKKKTTPASNEDL